MERPYGVLFISRRNSARSLMAEAVVNRHGKGRFVAYSAAVEPTHEADPFTLQILEQAGYPTQDLRAKHWCEFAGAGAPTLDFVFTMSATASREAFPDFPGKPAAAHWRYADPVKASGDDWQRKREFARTLASVERQMRIFMQLSFEALDRMALQKRLDELALEQTNKEPAH
jgi:arsenate reductase